MNFYILILTFTKIHKSNIDKLLLEKYDTESKSVLGYENDDYAVDIEILSLNDKMPKSKNDFKLEARNLANDLGLKDIIDVDKLPLIDNGYCVKAHEIYENSKNPVFVLYIINYKYSFVYEATIYCYNSNTNVGMEIANSFELLD